MISFRVQAQSKLTTRPTALFRPVLRHVKSCGVHPDASALIRWKFTRLTCVESDDARDMLKHASRCSVQPCLARSERVDLLDEACSSRCLVRHPSGALGCSVEDARVWNKTVLVAVCPKPCPQPIPLFSLLSGSRQAATVDICPTCPPPRSQTSARFLSWLRIETSTS